MKTIIIDGIEYNLTPKAHFKKGDWITNGEYTWNVTDIKPLVYILQSQNGDEIYDFISYVDENFHLWTIEDAKDGDVLAIGDEYFLFKKKKENTSPAVYISHCFADSAGAFRVTNGRDCGEFLSIENGIKACPATKEQRDLLFTKMKEAGYEWDAENKELKQLTQSVTKINDKEWSKEDEEMMKDIIDTIQFLVNTNESWSYLEDHLDWLKSLKDRI